MEEKQRYQDTTLSAEERADALLHLMTVEEKFAQLQCCYVYEAEKKVTNGIGHLGTLFYEAEDAGKWWKTWNASSGMSCRAAVSAFPPLSIARR